MERRNTHQKELILRALNGKGVHRTAEEILQEVRKTEPGIGLATVYRNLNLFTEQKLIQKIEGPGWSCYDGNPVPHDHFHCVRCGLIEDYPSDYSEKMDQTAEEITGGRVLYHSTTYEGICSHCMKQETIKKSS